MKGIPLNIIFIVLLLNQAGLLNSAALKTQQLNSGVNVSVEKTKFPDEEVFLHLDRNKYVAGEEVWFSIYNINTATEKLSSSSVIAYVELLNPWNRSVVQARYALDGGRGEGNFTIPDTVSSGTFIIRSYTYRMESLLPENCYMAYLDVYNPFKNSDFLRKSDSSVSTAPFRVIIGSVNERGLISVSDTVFGRREKVTLKIGSVYNGRGNRQSLSDLSISVSPSSVVSEMLWKYPASEYKNEPDTFRIENEGHFLSGRIIYRHRNIPDSSHFLYMSVQGKVAEFRYADIDSSGRFTFILPPDTRKRNLILQPDHPRNDMVLEIEPSFSRLFPSIDCIHDNLSLGESEIFSRLSFNYQASKIYEISSVKLPAADNARESKKRRFYGIPEMEIHLDDYIRLPSMQEVFFELLPGIIIRPKRDGYELKITNPLTGVFYNEPPLVMIDGVIINDLNVLVDLDPETVEKIEVVKTPYLIGDMILHGIVNVITLSGDFSDVTMPEYAVILPYRIVEEPCLFVSPDYSDERLRTARKPDLRNTLFWNPSVSAARNGESEIEFWTSDLPGNYLISVYGTTSSGEILSASRMFRVK
jgi:hypothetical protein